MTGRAGSFVCDNFHVLRVTVLQTDSIWISSPDFLAEDLRQGRMMTLDVADLAATDSQISLIAQRGRTRSPAAKVVIDQLKARLSDG